MEREDFTEREGFIRFETVLLKTDMDVEGELVTKGATAVIVDMYMAFCMLEVFHEDGSTIGVCDAKYSQLVKIKKD